MTALSDGVLLADVRTAAGSTLSRSANGGATWTDVLTLAPYRTLSPHSFDELDGVVYFIEYQDFTLADTPVHLWTSTDRGRTWTVGQTFTGHRHGHAVRVDPATGALWVFFGDWDAQPAIVRSLDGGETWETMLTGEAQARVVDALFTPAGLLYGLDVSPPLVSGILRLAPSGAVARLSDLPGPSYSIHQMRSGGFLCGTTREPKDIYPPPGEENAYVFGSRDGSRWNEVARFPRLDPDEYAQADVYWELATGEAVLHLFSVEPMYSGYELAVLNLP